MMIHLPLLVEPETLEPVLNADHLLLLDVSSEQHYVSGHIPGALNLLPNKLICQQPPAPGKPPSLDSLVQTFQNLGLMPDSHVVAYDNEGGGWAGRLIWTLDLLGHRKYAYLNGGLQAWIQAGLPLELTQNTPTPSAAIWQLNNEPTADKTFILTHLDDPKLVIWDARSPGEYQNGHIPGAVNYEWTRAQDLNNALRLRELDVINSELSELGITPDKTIVTHCQTHHRSGLTYFLGKLLGFPEIKAYPGSWAEWSKSTDVPIET